MTSNKVGEYPSWLVRFVEESNRIEGIHRDPTDDEIKMTQDFLNLDLPRLNDVKAAALVFTRGKGRVRVDVGMDVMWGSHVLPPGGPIIAERLDRYVRQIISGQHTPFAMHRRFEELHPFMDGNGRTGRLLWAWQMEREGGISGIRWHDLGFLHTWYYQSLEKNDIAIRRSSEERARSDWKEHHDGDLTLYELDGEWHISEYQCWIPGVYASEEAARYAVTMHPSVLGSICEATTLTITLEDLEKSK